MLASMRHYVDALAPIRRLRVDWREPLAPESDIPPEPRVPGGARAAIEPAPTPG